MTVVGAASAIVGAGWTLFASFDPAGVAIAVAGLAALAYDQLIKGPREEIKRLEQRRQLDLVAHAVARLLDLRRATPQEDRRNAPPSEHS